MKIENEDRLVIDLSKLIARVNRIEANQTAPEMLDLRRDLDHVHERLDQLHQEIASVRRQNEALRELVRLTRRGR